LYKIYDAARSAKLPLADHIRVKTQFLGDDTGLKSIHKSHLQDLPVDGIEARNSAQRLVLALTVFKPIARSLQIGQGIGKFERLGLSGRASEMVIEDISAYPGHESWQFGRVPHLAAPQCRN
jgi:hypothetical protein